MIQKIIIMIFLTICSAKKINQNKPKKEYWKNLIYPKEINETENMTIRDKKDKIIENLAKSIF